MILKKLKLIVQLFDLFILFHFLIWFILGACAAGILFLFVNPTGSELNFIISLLSGGGIGCFTGMVILLTG